MLNFESKFITFSPAYQKGPFVNWSRDEDSSFSSGCQNCHICVRVYRLVSMLSRLSKNYLLKTFSQMNEPCSVLTAVVANSCTFLQISYKTTIYTVYGTNLFGFFSQASEIGLCVPYATDKCESTQ